MVGEAAPTDRDRDKTPFYKGVSCPVSPVAKLGKVGTGETDGYLSCPVSLSPAVGVEQPAPEITGNNRGAARRRISIATARLSANPALPRLGRLKRQCQRAFVANGNRPLTTSEIWPWCYPSLKRAKHWHRAEVRRALLTIAHPIGRSVSGRGRPGIWAL
jgi:hypothetical protein